MLLWIDMRTGLRISTQPVVIRKLMLISPKGSRQPGTLTTLGGDTDGLSLIWLAPFAHLVRAVGS